MSSLFNAKRVIFFFLFLSFTSCSKKDKISPSDPKTEVPNPSLKGIMEVSNINVLGYQILNIKIKDLVLDKPEYEVEIGDKKVKAIRNLDNSIDFMIPGSLSNGKYTLKMAIASNTVEVNLTAPVMLADPEKTFKAFIGSTSIDLDALTAELKLTQPPQYLIEAKQKLDEGLVKFNALSVADKQIAAQVIEANSKALNEVSLLLEQEVDLAANRTRNKASKGTLAVGSCGWGCYFGHATKIAVAAYALTTTSTIIAPAFAAIVTVDFVASVLTGKRAVLMTKVKAKLFTTFEWTFFPQIKYAVSIIDEGFSTGITNMAIKQEKIVKGEIFTFKLTPVYRSLLRSDATIPTMPEAASFVNAYDMLRAAYEKELEKTMGPLPSFVVKEEKIAAKLLADWGIKVVVNSNVTVTAPQGLPHLFTVKFDSKAKDDQEFQFDISLKSPVETVTERVSAILVNPDADKIEMLSRNDQTGESNETVPQLRLIVKDKRGEAMEGVKVHWVVTAGGGTLTQYPLIQNTETLTDAEGIAKVDWTLGMSGEQSVEAIVKKRDGSNVSGSPLIFRATIASPNKIATFDGDNQIGEAGKKLPKLLKVKVLDEKGLPLSRARIKWVALQGGGKMNLNETFTNIDGIAEAELTAGPEVYQLVQATTVKKDGTVIQANFSVTLFSLLGKWQVESENYRRYSSGGTLLDEYEDGEFGYLEFGNNGKVVIEYDGDPINGNYVLDLVNGFVTISTADPDDDERQNSKFKMTNRLASSFTMTSDKIPVRGSYMPSGSNVYVNFPPGSYEIVELKLRKQ